MSIRFLKAGDDFKLGHNGKKLRYIINDKTITVAFPGNWPDDCIEDLCTKNTQYKIIKDIKKRGRPVKPFKHTFKVGDRVKTLITTLITTTTDIGNIIGFAPCNTKAVIKLLDNDVTVNISDIRRVRGRKPKKIIEIEIQRVTDPCILEILNYEGKSYLINHIDEVTTMDGDYIGVYVGDIIC